VASSRAEDATDQTLLAGLHVVEIGSGVGAAYAGKLLADLGADVVKVEPPEGDPLRTRGPGTDGRDAGSLFTYLCGAKRSVTVDLDSDHGVELVHDLSRA
jgi:crotonobetainyl-CoA:carnitine CoA-transferase CaiB-like acyl-CoA transferase